MSNEPNWYFNEDQGRFGGDLTYSRWLLSMEILIVVIYYNLRPIE